MIRDEEKPLHDLPETRGMTARDVTGPLGTYTARHALTESLWKTTEIMKGEFTIDDWAVRIEKLLAERGFQVLPAIPIPGGR